MRKPEKPRSPTNGGRLQLAEIEIGRFVDHLLREPVLDNVDRDRRRIDEAPMQRLEREAELLAAPDRGAGHAPDRSVLIESEAGEDARQRRASGSLNGLAASSTAFLTTVSARERNRLAKRFGRGRSGARPGERGRERPAEGQLQEFATLPFRHRISSFARRRTGTAHGGRHGVVLQPNHHDKSAP